MRVLIIDDSSSDRALVLRELERGLPELEALEAWDRESLEAALSKGPVDCVITDYKFPWTDGIELVQELRERIPGVPIVMATDSGSEEVAVEAMKTGLSDYVLKRDVRRLPHAVREAVRKAKLAEELEKAEARYRSVAELSPAGIYALNGTRFSYANPAFLSLVGMEPEELLGRDVREVFCHEEGDERCSRCLPWLLSAPGRRNTCQVRVKGPSGERWLENHVASVKEGDETGVMGVCIDVTERRELELQLVQAQKMEALGTLVGGIAHDFNNILSVIIGYTDLLKALHIGGQADDHLAMIAQAASKARDLVRNLLHFSRPSEQGNQPFDILPVVKETAKLLRSVIPTTIEIVPAFDKGPFVVETNPTHINQILINLCTNAHHAIGDGPGSIEIRLRRVDLEGTLVTRTARLPAGSYVLIEVKDTGCGMGEDVMERIFEPYFTTKEKGIGTGLGLSVVHGIVTGIGGGIDVESAPGEGALFRVFLPCAPGEETEETTAARPEPVTGEGRVLFVDDNESIVSVAAELLAHLGYEAEVYVDPREALAAFEKAPYGYDLVITDVTMPGMTGMELARRVKDIRPDIPLALLTGYSDLVDQDSAMAVGANALLYKPLDLHELGSVLAELLKER